MQKKVYFFLTKVCCWTFQGNCLPPFFQAALIYISVISTDLSTTGRVMREFMNALVKNRHVVLLPCVAGVGANSKGRWNAGGHHCLCTAMHDASLGPEVGAGPYIIP